MADSDVQEPFLNVVPADTASFFYYDLLEVEQNGGNLERDCIPPPRFRLSTKPPWRVHNKVDNARCKSPRYLPVSLKKYTIKHELEKYQCCHRKQAFPGKVSGSALLIRLLTINFDLV